jgi:tetratricopeptide (TPR) repeat protein
VFELNPSYAAAHQWYGGLLGEMGDPEAGLAEYRKAWSLDPRSRIIGYNFAWRLWGLQQNEQAWQVVNEVLGFAPKFPDALDLAMIISIFEGKCDQAYEYAQRLASLLNKPAGSAELYRDLCLPERRQQAVNTILTWENFGFADPAQPTLNYLADLLIIFVEMGRFEDAWQLFSRTEQWQWFSLSYMRTIRTPNGIRFQCSQRYRELLAKLEIPPAVDPVDCSVVDPVP